MACHLVIPDSHVCPGTNNDRFEWVGKLALDRRPDTVIHLGDWADMPSLSSYDRGKRSFEGRRYLADCAAVQDSLNKFDAPITLYNEQRRRNGKAQYRPRKVVTLGNHEHRINRAIEDRAELEGTMGIEDLGFAEHGWEVHRFLVPVEIDGIFYSHYFVTGVSGEAISGLNVASSILAKQMASCVAGHIHLLDYAVRSTPSGRRMMALSPGCFFDFPMPYAESTEHMWWRGVAILNGVKDGEYDLELISLKQLEKMYNNDGRGIS